MQVTAKIVRLRLAETFVISRETQDVAAAHPEIARRLADTLRRHRVQGFSRD